ncbi:hypothetical protein [Nocardia fluminea]|uniref:hypothetical protein n=1 Tax=Nocardia fluminea TaxID=134984 RepID=UPI003660FEAE
MTNAENLPAIDPQITGAAASLIDTVLSLGSGDLVSMRDKAENAVAQATALLEALEIETQGGQGAIEDGYRPADRKGVLGTIRRHLTGAVAERLTWRDDDGSLHMLWSGK